MSVIPDPAQMDWVPLWTLGNPSVPCARAKTVAAQNSSVGSAWQTVLFDGESFDTDGIHDTVTNNSRLTCRTAGKYFIHAHIRTGAPSTSVARKGRLLVNGATVTSMGGADFTTNVRVQIDLTDLLDLNVGDYVEVQVLQQSAAFAFPTDEGDVYFEMALVAPPQGSPFSTGPKVTTGPIASGPPASPVDGDIWIATAVDAAGTRWMFQYNASSGSAYKWEFIGGPPLYAHYEASSSIPSANAWHILVNSIAFATARGGDYWCETGAQMSGMAGGGFMQIGIGTNVATPASPPQAMSQPAASYMFMAAHAARVNGVGAAGFIAACYWANDAGCTFANRWLSAIPIRVS